MTLSSTELVPSAPPSCAAPVDPSLRWQLMHVRRRLDMDPGSQCAVHDTDRPRLTCDMCSRPSPCSLRRLGSPISSMAFLPEPPFTPLFPIYVPLSSLDPTVPNSQAGESVIPLPRDIFGVPLRRDILHQCVCHHRSLLKFGTKHVLGRAEVRGSGRKLHAQKGSGRARVGDSGSGIRESSLIGSSSLSRPRQPSGRRRGLAQ